MSVTKVPVLICDHAPCPNKWTGSYGQPPSAARRDARDAGWDCYQTSSDMFRVWMDYCHEHRDGALIETCDDARCSCTPTTGEESTMTDNQHDDLYGTSINFDLSRLTADAAREAQKRMYGSEDPRAVWDAMRWAWTVGFREGCIQAGFDSSVDIANAIAQLDPFPEVTTSEYPLPVFPIPKGVQL